MTRLLIVVCVLTLTSCSPLSPPSTAPASPTAPSPNPPTLLG